MEKTCLQMKYHPAKKEVEFRRFENGKEVLIRGGRLQTYMDKRGRFVLQDYGNAFFDDIAKVFDGIEQVNIEVITTKLDYDDFVQMVEYYNNEPNNKCQFTTKLIVELPDMKQTFIDVREFGKNAIKTLELHRYRLLKTEGIDNENVRKSAESFAKEIAEESDNIKEKIESMSDNNVSLCFTGVYSAGKSALINAIIGYRILPESIKSETAKMFEISSPRSGETEKIIFSLYNTRTVLKWDDSVSTLVFEGGPYDNDNKKEIQEAINNLNNKKKHEIICEVLRKINKMDQVAQDIKIEFPIALDNEMVQFTIYDTPGTDSNYEEHQKVLLDALSKQKQSILIFVAAPDKVEGTGNNVLLEYLKEVDTKDTKTTIDIGRSLFVINKAEGYSKEDRNSLQKANIEYKKEDGDTEFSIKLEDKKLFFVSAAYAYKAKAIKNDIATEDEREEFGINLQQVQTNNKGYLYKQNHFGKSELATKKMNEQCEEELILAINQDDKVKILEVCSGIYTLEQEIIRYGEKYSSAVKAYAIIDSVNKALSKLHSSADSVEARNAEDVESIKQDIEKLQLNLNRIIDEEYNKRAVKKNQALPEEMIKKLCLDAKSLKEMIVERICKEVNEKLDKTFWLQRVRYREADIATINSICNSVIDGYTKEFLKNRKKVLEKERDDFLEKIKNSIRNTGDISDKAKGFFLDIPAPKLRNVEEVKNLGEIYKANKYTKGIIFKKNFLNIDGVVDKIRAEFLSITEKMADDYKKDFNNALETVLLQIKSDFELNLKTYSTRMKGLIEDKNAMEELGGKVRDTARDLVKDENKLNEIIWKEAING